MQKINGNTDGIRRSYLTLLESLFEAETDRKAFCPPVIIETLAAFTGATGREAMVYLDRSGRIETINVGGQDRVSLPTVSKRRSSDRLSGIRCIHTHPGGNGELSDVDIQSLKTLKLDAMAAVGVSEGKPTFMCVSILGERIGEEDFTVINFAPTRPEAVNDEQLWAEIHAADERIRPMEAKKAEAEIARAILVGVGDKGNETLEELRQLSDTAGFITIGTLYQPRAKSDKATYLGQGRLHDLVLEVQRLNADTVIFDDELTPAQIRNIQKVLGKTEIIDRTALILDIFSGRASTHEGRLQVELAQAKYMLPRMTGFWTHLNRMGGGGAGGGGARRGEGETQLEVDRRILRKRVDELEREIDKVKARREVQRTQRERANIPVVALVGYTNAGKSTLMNRLSGSDVLAEDKLFATLDPVSRRVNYGSGEFLLVDTVGFIHKLPHDLVNAFRATLEETKYADLLIHVVDASSDEREKQMEVVGTVLKELGAGSNPTLLAFNKCDVINDTNDIPRSKNPGESVIVISAKTGMGMDALKKAVTQALSNLRTAIKILLPLNAGAMVSRIYEVGKVEECEYREDGIYLSAVVPMADAMRVKAMAALGFD
ncbi:MAG: GTPase HflX [Defluviitaleaceae bacterium]|nr:GTPase HflX [Defluviitaleaceae bacterium]